jgi:alanine racemase
MRLADSVDLFGVASIDEALILRSVGIKKPVVLMEGVFDFKELEVAAERKFDLVLHDRQQIKWLLNSRLSCPVRIWLKVDTGMGRLGFSLEELDQIHESIKTHPSVDENIGIMSHFSMAENERALLTEQQKIACIELMKKYPGLCSFVNSAGVFSFKSLHAQVVRPGICLYGVSPFPGVTGDTLGLKAVMTLKSRLIAVKTLPKGHAIGYTGSFLCPEKMPIGIVALGYGDGYPRSAMNGTPFLINGTLCPLIGKVSMDMLAVDLRLLSKSPCVGDEVLVWGDGLPIETVAQYTGTISYEMLTRVQQRVIFQWK